MDELKQNKKKRLIVISAPSGGGKSVVAKYIIENFVDIHFSISTTTRKKRENEYDKIHYYFIEKAEFEEKIAQNEFVEYEEIFGNYYGTLKSEIEKAFSENKILLFDVDVKGAFSLKKHYPDDAILIFLEPPSLEILAQRLRNRNTEQEIQIQKRISRAELEIANSKDFDFIICNDILQNTLDEVDAIVKKCCYCNSEETKI